MNDQVLDILKWVLLGVLYLFFLRVLWTVWSELRPPAAAKQSVAPGDPTVAEPRPATRRRARRGRGGRVARLVFLEPKARKGEAYAASGELTVGRDAACSIVISDDSFVSSLHLRVYDYEGQPMVEDLGSTNGSFHNGNKLIGAKLLHPGDRIQIGHSVLEAQ